VHAEMNAIAKCKSDDNSKVMICTLSPCVMCATLIVNTRFDCVYYLKEWKDTAGLEILEQAGIAHSLLILD